MSDYADRILPDYGKGHSGMGRRGKRGRADRGSSGTHRGGWSDPVHAANSDGDPITIAYGWGTKAGESLIADGHVDPKTFRQSANHNHYGSGQGPNDNVKDRGRYSGPGA